MGIGLEHGVDGIILRITDENGAGAAAGVVDGDILESVNGVDVRTLEYDKQLQRVVEAKGRGMVEVGVQRLAGGITETSLLDNNDGGDGALNRTRSYMVANPKGVALGTITLPKSKSTNIDVVLVRLRETGSFGFGFGTASNGVKVVAVIDHDGVAFDKLHVGDVISAVNGVPVENMSHGQTNNALVAGGNVVRVGVIRRKGGGVVISQAMASTIASSVPTTGAPEAAVGAVEAVGAVGAVEVGVPGEKWV